MVYNGRVLTWLMDGCPEFSHLCDISVFHDRVSPFATRKHHGCGVEEGDVDGDLLGDNEAATRPTDTASNGVSVWDDARVWIIAMASSFVLGGLLTCLWTRCCRWQPRRNQRNESQLVSTGKDSSDGFLDEPDVVIN